MTIAKSMPLVNQMAATPSDWRERTIPSQEQVSRTRKVTRSRSQESGGDARRRVESDVDGVRRPALMVVMVSIDYSFARAQKCWKIPKISLVRFIRGTGNDSRIGWVFCCGKSPGLC